MSEVRTGMVDNLEEPQAPPSWELLTFLDTLLEPGPGDAGQTMASAFSADALDARAEAEAVQRARDWPNLGRYRAANAKLAGAPRPRVVFMGNSITELWQIADRTLFVDGLVNRGINGQTSPQMLLRFYPDVIALKPKAVHIMGGANDVAGNTGPSTPQDYKNNVLAMSDLAAANGIAVIIGAIPPVDALWPSVPDPIGRVMALNEWLHDLATERGFTFVDYHSALRTTEGGMRSDLAKDGLHPHRGGYAVMKPLLMEAISQTAPLPTGA